MLFRTPFLQNINQSLNKLNITTLTLLPIALLSIVTYSTQSHAEANVQEFKLDNGLKLIVQEDHRSPVVVSQVWYRAGALDEVNGKSGVAHVLEHMMFKGTKQVPAGQFSRQIAAAGGKENAFTGQDYTCYFQQLEKSKLPLAFKLEADRMQNLQITKEEYDKEIKVVMEERRWRTDDKPQAQVNEEFQAVAYKAHPYQRPVIGWMNDLENMTYLDAQEWYKTWYAPNNATIVVVGDIDAQAVFKLARENFGGIKAHVLPARKPQTEPAQKGERSVIVKAPAKSPYILIGFHAPTISDAPKTPEQAWEPYALEVLAGVLSGNDAARLNQHLVREQQIAVDVSAGYDSSNRGRESLFELDGTPSEGKTVEQLQAALLAQVEIVKTSGATADELNRIKASVIASEVYKRDSMFGQAMELGTLETTGYSWKLTRDYIANIKAVTSEQVQAVAKKYLVKDNMTVATLDPQPIDPNAKPQGKPHVH